MLFLFCIATLLFLLWTPAATASDVVVAQEAETEMESSSGSVEILVTLEDPSTGDLKIMEDRKREVGRSQRALVRYAESTDGVRVLNEFWITNAVLLEVEPRIG